MLIVTICGDVTCRVVFDKIIGLSAHNCIRIADNGSSVFPECQACQKIDLPVQKLLVQLPESAVHIFISPSCILGELAVVLVGVARLDGTLLSTLLENFVFVVTDSDDIAVSGECRAKRHNQDNYHNREEFMTHEDIIHLVKDSPQKKDEALLLEHLQELHLLLTSLSGVRMFPQWQVKMCLSFEY